MPVQWSTSAQEAVANGIKVIVYGDAGLGKTVLAATCPKPLLISNESGVLSLAKSNLERLFGVNTAGICYDIPIMKINDAQSFEDAYTFCSTNAWMKDIDTICLDSISEMGEAMLNMLKRTVKDPRQAYGEVIERMETVIRKFRDLPGKHVYIAAKMEPIKDELTGISRYGISMPGAKLGPKLPFFFDEVFWYGQQADTQGKLFRFLRTQPDPQHTAKDRSGVLEELEYPHLGAIFNKITSGVKK